MYTQLNDRLSLKTLI